MPKHDWKCNTCKVVIEDRLPYGEKRTCDFCGKEMEITLENWTDVGLHDHGRAVNERTDRDGYIKNFRAGDLKLARIELGLHGSPADKTLRTFSPEQAAEYRRKIMVEGDSPKLMHEILDQRKANQQAAKPPKSSS